MHLRDQAYQSDMSLGPGAPKNSLRVLRPRQAPDWPPGPPQPRFPVVFFYSIKKKKRSILPLEAFVLRLAGECHRHSLHAEDVKPLSGLKNIYIIVYLMVLL